MTHYRLAERVKRLREQAGGLVCPHCGRDVPPPEPKRIELIECVHPPVVREEMLGLATLEELEQLERLTDAMYRRYVEAEGRRRQGGRDG